MHIGKILVAGALTAASLTTAAGAQSNGDRRVTSIHHSSGSADITVEGGHVSLHGSGSGVLVKSAAGHFTDEGVFQPGDVIRSIDGKAVGVPEDLFGYVRAHPQAQSFEITVERGADVGTHRVTRSFFKQFMTPPPPQTPMPPMPPKPLK